MIYQFLSGTVPIFLKSKSNVSHPLWKDIQEISVLIKIIVLLGDIVNSGGVTKFLPPVILGW